MHPRHEQRRSKRIPTYIDVRWCRKDDELLAKATDINADGMFLQTNEPVLRGTLLELRLQLPDRELPVFATAVFVGQTAAGVGVGLEFYMMSSQTRLAWLSFYQMVLEHHEKAEKGVGAGGGGAGDGDAKQTVAS
jgi:hypothetical protein